MARTSGIDRVLQEAVERGAVGGVIGVAADATGPIYEGAFGERLTGSGVAMTPDTIFLIASMTKAITAAAAMQLVEQGKITLDEPLGRFAPQLGEPRVLTGFDASGAPELRPAKRAITLRQLLTHTAGFGYDVWNPLLNRYVAVSGLPPARSGKLASLNAPLVFDPGERWEYGINIDWVGRVVEAISGQDLDAYTRTHVLAPLGMRDSGYVMSDAQALRGAGMHIRGEDGALTPEPFQRPMRGEFLPGGGGMFSTAGDYLRFLRMLIGGGALDGTRVLRPETVALMGQNHMGALNVLPMKSYAPAASNDVELFAGMVKKWGLSFLINTEPVAGGRSAGSLAWAGLRNTYFWLDPNRGVGGVLLTQVLPFADRAVLDLLDAFEREVYKALA